MRLRSAAALAAVLAALAGAPAVAAPRVACRLVSDARGDGTVNDNGPSHDALDVLSADLATGRRNLVAVVRFVSTEPDPALTSGVVYTYSWSAGGVGQSVTFVRYAGGAEEAHFDPDTGTTSGGTVAVRAVVDDVTASVTWTVPRPANPELRRKGLRFGYYRVGADPSVNATTPPEVPYDLSARGTLLTGDSASGTTLYTDLAPSCVKGV